MAKLTRVQFGTRVCIHGNTVGNAYSNAALVDTSRFELRSREYIKLEALVIPLYLLLSKLKPGS